MQIAAPFKFENQFNDKISEFNINYSPGLNDFKKLVEFVDMFKDKRVNIRFKTRINMDDVSILSKYDNAYIRVESKDFDCVKSMRENGFKFFFDSTVPAYNIASLDYLVSLGTTDVYLYDDLMYVMDDIKKYCGKKDIGTRIILNKIPSILDYNKLGYDARDVIPRPEDKKYLDEYFDTCEFDCGEPYDWHLFNVLQKVWFKDKKWAGDLREINKDLRIEYMNRSILPSISSFKFNCGQRCRMIVDYACDKCNQAVEIASSLDSKGIGFKV